MDQKQQKIQQCYIIIIEKAAMLPMALSMDTAYNLQGLVQELFVCREMKSVSGFVSK